MTDEGSTLGAVLRGFRSRHGWTLKEMSDRVGIPLSTLSKIEHDRLTLTYDKLLQLSGRLNIPVSELFAGDSKRAAIVTGRRSIGKMDVALHLDTPNYEYFFLCTDLRQKRMIPNVTIARAKSLAEFGELVKHSGEEFIYVLEGGISVETEFYDPVDLSQGESIYIDSGMGHAYIVGQGFDTATLLCMMSGDLDEVAHLVQHHGAREQEAVIQKSAPARRSEAPRKRRAG